MVLTIPVERISAEARRVNLAKAILTLLAVIPFVAGWLAGKTWLAVAWTATAVRVGWQQARSPGGTDGEGG